MACIRHIHICCFLLAVIAGQVFLCAEGRQLKKFNKQKSDSFEHNKGQGNQGKEPVGSKQIPVGNKGDLQVAGPPPSHDISGAKELFPPISAIGPNSNPKFGSSLTEYANGFQPTTPGNSPGVGHSHEGRKEKNEQKATSRTPNVTHSLDANRDDFRPTGPGRSPGVGHSYQSTNTEPNA